MMTKFFRENNGQMDPKKMTEQQLLKLKSYGKKPIPFEIKNFLTKQEMFDFIQSPNYRSPTVAGLCFAIQIDEVPNNQGYNI